MRRLAPLTLLLSAVAVLACDARAPAPSGTRIQSSPMPEGSSALALRLDVPSPVSVGQVVDFRVVLVNRSDTVVSFEGPLPEAAFNVLVRGEDGVMVWSRLDDVAVPGMAHSYTLAPRDSLVYVEQWSPRTVNGGPVPAGHYTVTATFYATVSDTLGTSGVVPSAGPLLLRVLP